MNNNRRKRIQKVFDSIMDLRSQIEEIRDEEQEAFDNMPESFQEGEKGEMSQNAIDNLDSALSDMDSLEDSLQEAMQ